MSDTTKDTNNKSGTHIVEDADNTSSEVDNEHITGSGSGGSVALEDVVLPLTQRSYLTLGVFVTILLFSISATWFLVELFIVQPKDEKIVLLQKEKALKENTIDGLKEVYSTLQRDFTEINKLSRVPTLLNPVAGKHITGRFIPFRWKYEVNPGFQNFILELKHIKDDGSVLTKRYQIPDPDRKKLDFEVPVNTKGEFYWRIGTGEMLAVEENKSQQNNMVGEIVSHVLDIEEPVFKTADTHLWSRYGNFNVYKSVYDKIKETGELTVGMTATFLSYDHTIDCQGRPNTFDMDFIEWIAGELDENYMNTPINVVRKIYKWKELLNAVHLGEVDVAVANITRTTVRERDNPNMRFTSGYRNSNQRIIFSKQHLPDLVGLDFTKAELKKKLRGKTLATQVNTINTKAAAHIKQEFGFKHDFNYDSYVDVIHAVRHSKADFGMIDSVRIETVDYPEMEVVDFDLNPLLEDMYLNISETAYEMYGIAVHANSPKSKLLQTLNEIIDSDAWDVKREELIIENAPENLQPPGVC